MMYIYRLVNSFIAKGSSYGTHKGLKGLTFREGNFLAFVRYLGCMCIQNSCGLATMNAFFFMYQQERVRFHNLNLLSMGTTGHKN